YKAIARFHSDQRRKAFALAYALEDAVYIRFGVTMFRSQLKILCTVNNQPTAPRKRNPTRIIHVLQRRVVSRSYQNELPKNIDRKILKEGGVIRVAPDCLQHFLAIMIFFCIA